MKYGRDDFLYLFKPPFRADDMGVYMFDVRDQMVCHVEPGIFEDYDLSAALLTVIAEAVNGSMVNQGLLSTVKDSVTFPFYAEKDIIYSAGGKPLIEIRGWGYLTGTMKMPVEEASGVQDNLARYITEKINAAASGGKDAGL